MSEFFLHFSQMRQRHPSLVPQRVENFKAHNISKRIDATVRTPPVLFSKTWHEEIRAIPIFKLRRRDPGETLYLFFAKGADDRRSFAHSAPPCGRITIAFHSYPVNVVSPRSVVLGLRLFQSFGLFAQFGTLPLQSIDSAGQAVPGAF